MHSARGSVERPCVAAQELRQGSLELVVLTPPGRYRVSSELLERSFVVQKRAVRTTSLLAQPGYAVHFRSPEDMEPFVAACEWPRTGEAWDRWTRACDYLLIGLRPHEVSYAIVNVLRPFLEGAKGVPKVDPLGAEASRLVRSGHEAPLASYPGADGYDARPARKEETSSQRREQILRGVLDFRLLLDISRLHEMISYAGFFIRSNLSGEDMEDDEKSLFHLAPQDMSSSVAIIAEALYHLSLTVSGSLYLLEKLPELKIHLGDIAFRYLVQRAFAALYLAECLGATEAVFMPLRTAKRLQNFYISGNLTLNCFLPVKEHSFFMLPGLLGRREVPALFTEPEEVLEKAAYMVPWLREVLCSKPDVFLTGSLLCCCRSSSHYGPPPGDCDLFCISEEALEETSRVVAARMLDFSREHGFGKVTVDRLSERRVKISLDRGFAPSSSRIFEDCCFSCDLYVNDFLRLSHYHLAQVRACLFVDFEGVAHLNLLPSAAIAWIQMISLDYHEIRGRRSAAEIITTYWKRGFNILMQRMKLREMTSYLTTQEPEAWSVALQHQRPQRLTPFRHDQLRF